MKKNKLLYMIIMVFVISLVAVFFYNKGNNSKTFTKDNLIIWGDAIHNQAMNEGLKEFKEKYPNVKVEFYKKDAEKIMDDFSKIKNKSNYPNIICLNDRDVTEFGAKYYKDMLVLNDVMKSSLKDFIPCKRSVIELYDNYIAVPYTVEPIALYYRKDLLKKYNINPDDIKTWEDFIKVGEEVYKKSNGKIRMISFNKEDNSMLKILLNEKGINYFDKDNNLQIGEKDSVDVFNILKAMEKSNIIFNNKGNFKIFLDNNIVCMPYNSKLANYLISERPKEKGKWGVMKLPSFELGGKNSAVGGGTSLVAIKSCKSSKDNLSMDLIKSIGLNKTSVKDAFCNYGEFPSYIPSYDYTIFSDNVVYFDNKQLWKLFSNISNTTPDMNYTKNFNDVEKVMINFKKQLLNSNDVEKELKGIKRFINSVIN